MLEHSYYSVISPEGCAGILWKSHEHAPKAADALKFTSKHLPGLDVVDDIIAEPLGGAHRDHQQMAIQIKQYLLENLKQLKSNSVEELLAQRYEKFRAMGKFLEEA